MIRYEMFDDWGCLLYMNLVFSQKISSLEAIEYLMLETLHWLCSCSTTSVPLKSVRQPMWKEATNRRRSMFYPGKNLPKGIGGKGGKKRRLKSLILFYSHVFHNRRKGWIKKETRSIGRDIWLPLKAKDTWIIGTEFHCKSKRGSWSVCCGWCYQ